MGNVLRIGVFVLLGCGAHPDRVPVTMVPIGVDTRPESTSTTDTSPVEPPRSDVKTLDECPAAQVDDLAQRFARSDCDAEPESPPDLEGKLKVQMTASTLTTSPGGRVDVRFSITNETSEKVPIFVRLTARGLFDIGAFDSRGKRVDMPDTKPRPPKDARTGRITLLPGGVIHASAVWDATRKKISAKGAISSAGALARGKYTLRAALPILGIKEEPTAPLEVR